MLVLLERLRASIDEAQQVFRKLEPSTRCERPCNFGGPFAQGQCVAKADVEVTDSEGNTATFCRLHASRFRDHPLFAVRDL